MKPEQAKQLTEVLKKVDFLTYLSLAEMEKLSRAISPYNFDKGDVVIKQGETGDTFYLISKGKVGVFREGAGGKRTLVRYLGPGEYFGEMSLLTGEPRNATVVVEEPTEFFVLYKNDFKNILENNSAIIDLISGTLSHRRLQLSIEAHKHPVDDGPMESPDKLADKIKNFFHL